MANNVINEKKRVLIARKEKLLQDIQYYNKRISEFHSNKSATSFYEDNYSSDSDTDFPLIDNGPSVTQLKLQQSHLKTSLQATQELTNLHLLESEVNVMVDDPIIVDEPQVREPGVWREVIAECRLDLVPFTINFHVHTPDATFGARSYRNLKVSLVKAAHEVELARSVLAYATTPSEAVEVLRSYSLAHRSRRTTLARLAEKYPNLLFMEPLTEGGYMLKCAGLLEVCWTLQNKWSPIAPFHHRMRFDLEYMDESYIKIITQYHRQLSDPSIETDERTALLSKIINTCLDAKGPTQELYESMESDHETAEILRKRRTTLDQEVTETAPKRKKDDGIMAPPKSLPKKSKPKGKENRDKGDNDDRQSYVSKDSVRSNVDADVTNASGKDSVASAKSKDIRKDNVKSKAVDDGKDIVGKNAKDNVKNSVQSTDENKSAKNNDNVIDKKVTNSKESFVNAKSKQSGKESISTFSTNGHNEATKDLFDKKVANNKESLTSTKSKQSKKENAKSTNEVIDTRKESVEKSAKGKKNVNTATASTSDIGKVTDKVNKEANSNNDNVASAKVSKKITTVKKGEDGNKNGANVVKKSIVKATDKREEVENNAKVNADAGATTKSKVNAKSNNVEVNNLNSDKSVKKLNKKADDTANVPTKKLKMDQANINTDINNVIKEKSVKKVKKIDDIANIPNKKSKIDQATTKVSNANVKSGAKQEKPINTNKAPKNSTKPNNMKTTDKTNAKTTMGTDKKDSTYTKNSETIEKTTEKNEIVTTKSHLDERTYTTDGSNAKNKDTNSKTSNIYNKMSKKSLNNIQKVKTLKSNMENNKNLNNEKLTQKIKVTDNIKSLGTKKLSAGNTQKDNSTDSKVSKIPQKSTKVASSMKKNPLRISPRKLPASMKSVHGIKKPIHKPITSIPRLLKKPTIKP